MLIFLWFLGFGYITVKILKKWNFQWNTWFVTFESTTYTDTLFECSSFAIDLQTTFKKMRKFDKMFLDDVFYNLNSLHKIENGDAPQMQHQAMFPTRLPSTVRTLGSYAAHWYNSKRLDGWPHQPGKIVPIERIDTVFQYQHRSELGTFSQVQFQHGAGTVFQFLYRRNLEPFGTVSSWNWNCKTVPTKFQAVTRTEKPFRKIVPEQFHESFKIVSTCPSLNETFYRYKTIQNCLKFA